jgi:catechol 2,3-dioxygenase-like lactoylglutathione lyase family enzyme
MFDHVTIRVTDRAASRRFYDTVLDPLGVGGRYEQLFDEWGDFSIAPVSTEHPATRRLHVGFAATSRDAVDQFWRAAAEAGYQSDGEPGTRPIYHEEYYGAFLLDPDGNSAEAVYHGRPREGNDVIDHLWLRVADPDASGRFYATIAPVLGLTVRVSRWGVAVDKGQSSFTLLPEETTRRTKNVHIAFLAPNDQTVREFHRAATQAGHRDNGGPGERPVYHPGYYGAFALDPDGNNIEAVNHNR